MGYPQVSFHKLAATVGVLLSLACFDAVYGQNYAPTTEPDSLPAILARLQARGEPISLSDLATPAVADADNAAWYLKQAGSLIVAESSGPRNSALEYGLGLPYPPEWNHLAGEMVQVNPQVFELARQARKHEKANWGIRYDLPAEKLITQTIPSFSSQRALANMLGDASLWQHFEGNDEEALAYVEDSLAQIRALKTSPFLVSELVTVGLDALMANTVQILATDMNITKPKAAAIGKPASRDKVKLLIATLLDDQAVRQRFQQALREERVLALIQVSDKAAPTGSGPWGLEILAYFDTVIEQANQSVLTRTALDQKTDPLQLAKSLSRSSLAVYRNIYCRRAAAVGLAVRLYWLDNGKYPAKLEDLVPAYLPNLPRDPLARVNHPLTYILAENGRRPLVGSAGDNGEYDTRDEKTLPTRTDYGWRDTRHEANDDQWIDLSVRP